MPIRYPDKVLRNALISDATVSGMVGDRVFNQTASPADPLPFIICRRSGIEREQTFGGPMGVPRLSMDFDLYAVTYEEVRELADAVRDVLDGFGGTFDNTTVKQVSLEDESDELVQLAGSEKPPAFAVKMSFDIWWQET